MRRARKKMKILAIDIETSPNLADVWGLWNQNISLSQLRESSRTMCFGAKFIGERKSFFFSEFHNGYSDMVAAAHDLMSTADVLVHWNGKKFDVPTLNKEILLEDLAPPAPFKELDLMLECRKHFRFPSNKLDYVANILGLGSKVKHEGHILWQKCLTGDKDAWRKMKTYNMQDVYLLEGIYNKTLPWLNHPHRGLYAGIETSCPNCPSADSRREGYAYLETGKYQRYQCLGCGKWFRGTKRVDSVNTKGVQ
jgi:hypothetical protein